MAKRLLPVLLLAGLISLSISASAESFSLYGNLDDNNQYCNLLIDYYYNTDDFDPFFEYVVFRSDQYRYYLVYGRDLDESDLSYILYTASYMSQPSSFTTGSLSSLDLSANGFSYVGNVAGSLTSQQFNDMKTKFFIVSGIFLFLLVFLYKVFRPKFNLSRTNRSLDL